MEELIGTRKAGVKLKDEEANIEVKDEKGKSQKVTLSQANERFYKNPTKKEKIKIRVSSEKEKEIVVKTYADGTVKNSLIRVLKNGVPLSVLSKKKPGDKSGIGAV